MSENSIRWGLIGASTIARERLVNAIRSNGGDITAVCSSNQGRADAFADALSIPGRTTDLVELFDRCDAVYVSSVNRLHYAHVIAAAAAGKHILCEKPLATSLDEASEMIGECRRTGVVLGVNHHLRGSTVNREMAALVRSGAIGQPLFARVVNAGVLPGHLHRGRLTDEAGNGIIFDKATHDIDLLRYLLEETPCEVTAMTSDVLMGSSSIAQAVMSTMRFASGLFAQTFDAFNVPGSATEVVINGTEGSFYASDCLSSRPAGTLKLVTSAGERPIQLQHVDPYGEVIRQFHLAITTGIDPLATGEDGRIALSIAIAMSIAAQSHSFMPIETLGLR
ncbi:Gfo/Idh/MocA family protein [Agrobacterium vaccinii]|uniref:Gfo/Idh/MocA family protein n=1 Tax=Agrobacterium vaccinii TaxID=2735528 RepID=UPI001E42E96F|nr:Gfo/Idh/MocA family oxidoreductase [Agrobacterium vaccinii]UHS58723.1 Gfo/Idh/MocA family oxidoreductase [Agrobacterium vaccinii]